jgi:hypothetical protein
MNIGEGLVAVDPKLAGAPKLGKNTSLHRPVISRRQKRQGALVVEGEAEAAPFVPGHPGKHRCRAEH